MAFSLNKLKPNAGSTRGKIRVGRGIGSGKGKTCGRGGKGQTARSGSAINGFEGGQTPIHRRLPKRGFKNYTRVEYQVVNISDVQKAVDAKKLSGAVTIESLKEAGLINTRQDVKLLGAGKLSAKIEISVQKAAASAVKAVEAAGGKVNIIPAIARAATPNPEKKAADKKEKKAAKKPAKKAK